MNDLLPILASKEGVEVDSLLYLLHGFIVLLFLAWTAIFVYCLWRFRSKRAPQANAKGLNSKAPYAVEAVIFVVEICLLAFISIPFWQKSVDGAPEAAAKPFHVRVVAQQFSWNVHYPGADGSFGGRRLELLDDVSNPLGLDPEDPLGKDDIVLRNQLYVPIDRPTVVELTSKDVIHSFAVPEFRVKRDAIPGIRNQVVFTPTMTTEAFQAQTGSDTRTFEIVCSQLCGLGHYSMRGFVYVLEDDALTTWLAENAPNPDEETDEFWDDF